MLRLPEAGDGRTLAAISHSKAVFNQSELKPRRPRWVYFYFFINRLSLGRASLGGRRSGAVGAAGGGGGGPVDRGVDNPAPRWDRRSVDSD